MHPVIRIVCLLLLAVWLARGTWMAVSVAAIGVLSAFGAARTLPRKSFWPMIWRLRWLAFPILVLYGWMSPLAQDGWPDLQGLSQGAARVTGLIVLVAAVHLINLRTDSTQWLAALYWLAYPLRLFGLSRGDMATRIHLVITNLSALQTDMRQWHFPKTASFRRGAAERLDAGWRWAQLRARLPVQEQTLDVTAPPWWQWGIPLLMALAGVLL